MLGSMMCLRDGIQLPGPGGHCHCDVGAGICHNVVPRLSSTLHCRKGSAALWSRACPRM